jgi:hypothetical protein
MLVYTDNFVVNLILILNFIHNIFILRDTEVFICMILVIYVMFIYCHWDVNYLLLFIK